MSGFFSDLFQTFQIGLGTFCILLLAFNFNQRWPRFKWDVTIDKFGFKVYIPIITSVAVAVLLTMLLKVLPTLGIGSTPFQ
jgi:hypothetical protein